MALKGIPKTPFSLMLSLSSLQEAAMPRLSGHVTSHLIATARGSVLYGVVAYYTTRAGIHTGLQLQKWLHTEQHVCNGTTPSWEYVLSLFLTHSLTLTHSLYFLLLRLFECTVFFNREKSIETLNDLI